MPSWQTRALSLAIRLMLRRRRWGRDERALARRARLLFGAPAPYAWWRTRGLRVEPVRGGAMRGGAVRGEWIVPPNAAAGAVLYVHGGGFVSCSPATYRPVTASLARLTRRRVFAVDYRLAPEHRFPAALDDVAAAYRWLLDSGVPASSVAVDGDSAGGGLVLALLQRLRDEGAPLPACAVCVSPWADLAGNGATWTTNAERDAMFHPDNTAEFAAAYLGGASPLDPRASPVYGDFAGLPPLLLQVGSTEILLDDAARAHERALAAGVASRIEVLDDTPHGWHMLDGLVPEATATLRGGAAFMVEHLEVTNGGGNRADGTAPTVGR
jgi:acetyl esterase/lipase